LCREEKKTNPPEQVETGEAPGEITFDEPRVNGFVAGIWGKGGPFQRRKTDYGMCEADRHKNKMSKKKSY